MLEIHERFECGIPVIIEGETGVGKTALVEMLSVLWNQSLLGDWRLLRERFLQLLKENCSCELNGYRVCILCICTIITCTVLQYMDVSPPLKLHVTDTTSRVESMQKHDC